MARPTNKEELLTVAKKNFLRLYHLVDQMSEEEKCATFVFKDRDRM